MGVLSICGTITSNTGKVACDFQRGNFRQTFVGGAKFLPSEYATETAFKAAILDRIHRPEGDPEKLYPFGINNGGADQTEEDAVETAPDGLRKTVRVAPESFQSDDRTMGMNQERAILSFNNTSQPVFVLDDTSRFYFKLDSQKRAVGNTALLSSRSRKFGVFTGDAGVLTTYSFSDAYAFTSNGSNYKFETFDGESFEGLVDLILTKVSSTGNAHTISAKYNSSQVNQSNTVYRTLATALADVDAWVGITSAGALVAPTSVTANAGAQAWVVTFSAAVAQVRLATPDVLFDNDIRGIESDVVTI